jgi:hypothetical protein
MERIDVELDCTHDIVTKYGVAECQNCGLEEDKISKQLTMKFRAFDPKTKTMVYSGTPDLETVSSFFHHWGDHQIMRSTERKDRNGVEIFEGDYLVDRYEDGESLFQVVYCPRLMAWAIDTSYSKDGSQMVSIHDYFGDCLEVKNPLPLMGS